jgi:hypothetical protein
MTITLLPHQIIIFPQAIHDNLDFAEWHSYDDSPLITYSDAEIR